MILLADINSFNYSFYQSQKINIKGHWSQFKVRKHNTCDSVTFSSTIICIKMVFKIHLLLLCIMCADTAEQVLWSLIKEMNDVYANLHVVHQREKTECIECGTRAKMINGESFSCHNGDQRCLVHDACLLKYNLPNETLITAVGWRHFCNSKGTFTYSLFQGFSGGDSLAFFFTSAVFFGWDIFLIYVFYWLI